MRILVVIVLIIAAAGAGFAGWYYLYGSAPAPNYRTATVERGTLLATISATGTIQPEEVIDYGTPVEPGTVLARIDEKLYKADVDQAQAQLDSNKAKVEQAKANVKKAEADLEQSKAKEEQTRLDFQ